MVLIEYLRIQAIEAAIELNLSKVEAGAQGEHKIQRGYLPVTTYSCHYFLEPGFATAIGNFLVHETAQVFRMNIQSISRDYSKVYSFKCGWAMYFCSLQYVHHIDLL
jgi:predicted N-acyltransferase